MIDKALAPLLAGGLNIIKLIAIGVIVIVLVILLMLIGIVAVLGILLVLAGLYVIAFMKPEIKLGIAILVIGIILAVVDLWIM